VAWRKASTERHVAPRRGPEILYKAISREITYKYIALRYNMTYISPDSLQNDSLNQRLMACGRSLSAMAASGQFVDDGSCD